MGFQRFTAGRYFESYTGFWHLQKESASAEWRLAGRHCRGALKRLFGASLLLQGDEFEARNGQVFV